MENCAQYRGTSGDDASLVLQHFGSKANLFAAAVKLPGNSPDEAADHLLDALSQTAGGVEVGSHLRVEQHPRGCQPWPSERSAASNMEQLR